MRSIDPERPAVVCSRALCRSCAGVRARTTAQNPSAHAPSSERVAPAPPEAGACSVCWGRNRTWRVAQRRTAGPCFQSVASAQHLLGPTHVLLQQLGLRLAPHRRLWSQPPDLKLGLSAQPGPVNEGLVDSTPPVPLLPRPAPHDHGLTPSPLHHLSAAQSCVLPIALAPHISDN